MSRKIRVIAAEQIVVAYVTVTDYTAVTGTAATVIAIIVAVTGTAATVIAVIVAVTGTAATVISAEQI